jgi:hypothetical protein
LEFPNLFDDSRYFGMWTIFQEFRHSPEVAVYLGEFFNCLDVEDRAYGAVKAGGAKVSRERKVRGFGKLDKPG